MVKRTFTVLFLLLVCSMMLFAQNKVVLKPIGATYISKSGHAPEIEVVKNEKGSIVTQNSMVPQVHISDVQGTIDTLSYRKTLPGTWNTNFGLFGQDVMVQWFEAPADLTIKAVGGTFSDNNNDTQGSFKIYKVGNGITLDSLMNVGPDAVKQGRFTALDPSYVLGYAAFEDESDGNGYETADGLSAFPFAEDIWSDVGFGYPFTPVTSTSDAPVYQYVETINLGFEPTVNRGEIFALVFKNESQDTAQGSTDDRIGFWSRGTGGNPDVYGWKFYVNGRDYSGDVSTAYWFSREYTWDMSVIVDLTGDRPPQISNVLALGTTASTSDREVTAKIVDDNPSGSTPGGVTAAALQWSTDGTNWNDVSMSNSGDNYSGMIPGQSAGTDVTYRISATDDNSNTSTSPNFSYSVFQKQNDVLLLYNDAAPFGNNTAKALYVGYPGGYIIDPVPCDIWTAADGTQEAAGVMALYNYVIQIDGQYPAVDFTDAAKEYLDGASAGDERNYLLSSQDYGCYITGDCSDITFAAGDFQYDYLGVETLGPQDLPGDIVGIEGVSGDPISGWVTDYESANSVGYFFDPFFELGFTSYIDALTPTSGATTTFTTDEQVCGVRNEGANWKTTFMTYDYAASNFRSDTSLAEGDDPSYAWGITVANQALKFLEWAGYVLDVKPVDGVTPTTYSLRQNYPNPFNPNTTINFSIPEQSKVVIKVYNILGSEVATLVNEVKNAGSYNVDFRASNLASGMYIYTINAGKFTESKKMMLLK